MAVESRQSSIRASSARVATLVRRTVIACCTLGLAGMIGAAVTKHVGAVIALGVVTLAATLCLMVATVVADGDEYRRSSPMDGARFNEEQGRRVEDLALEVINQGAEETSVRRLVREAVTLGRSAR